MVKKEGSIMKFTYNIFKAILAGVVAVIILSVILVPYSFTPVHISNDLKNTDYVWPANSYWMKMTEGVSFGRFDENGYNNLSVVDNPDIIIVGSSHVEATNVMQNKNLGYLLNEKLKNRYSVYNMGISGHNLFKVFQYLPKTLEQYDTPPKVIIVETSDVEVTAKDVDNVIEKTVDFTPSYNSGIVAKMQKVPFLRLAYHQIDGGLLNLFMPDGSRGAIENKEIADVAKMDTRAYNDLFTYLELLRDKYKTEIIIFYHPFGKLQEDGTIKFESTMHLDIFSATAKEHNINFVDMTQKFIKMYYEEDHVPHGFNTGKISSGHLNAYGHAAIADMMLVEINRLEGEGRICK